MDFAALDANLERLTHRNAVPKTAIDSDRAPTPGRTVTVHLALQKSTVASSKLIEKRYSARIVVNYFLSF